MQATIFSVHGWTNRIADLSHSSRRFIHKLTHIFRNLRFYFHASGKLRRFFLVHFRKEFVGRQLQIRQGTCRQCGACCNLLFTCPMLNLQGNCVTYGKCRPQACKIFPIDQRDVDEIRFANGRCGFYFSEKSIAYRKADGGA